MNMWDWLFEFVEPLNRAGLPYAIVGSVASSVYGEPRATNDVDIVIQLPKSEAEKLMEAFPSDRFYVPPKEVVELELARPFGGHVNVIALETMMKADFYPLTRFEAEWFSRRRVLPVDNHDVWFAVPESVILHKLRFYREGGGEKHLRDIRGMLQVSGEALDHAALERAVAEFGVTEQWEQAKRF